MQELKLAVQFYDYWLAGSGAAEQPWLDEEMSSDGDGLPWLPGRSLKGALRDAVRAASAWGWLEKFPLPENSNSASARNHALTNETTKDCSQDWDQFFFGSASNLQSGLNPDQSQAGRLYVGNAQLPAELLAKLKPEHKLALSRELHATAIDESLGSAKDRSLRSVQVAIPLTLFAQIHSHAPDLPENWREVLVCCLPLIRSLGSQRSRGLGRVQIRCLSGDQP